MPVPCSENMLLSPPSPALPCVHMHVASDGAGSCIPVGSTTACTSPLHSCHSRLRERENSCSLQLSPLFVLPLAGIGECVCSGDIDAGCSCSTTDAGGATDASEGPNEGGEEGGCAAACVTSGSLKDTSDNVLSRAECPATPPHFWGPEELSSTPEGQVGSMHVCNGVKGGMRKPCFRIECEISRLISSCAEMRVSCSLIWFCFAQLCSC